MKKQQYMSVSKIKSGFLIFIMIFFFITEVQGENSDEKGRVNYLALEKTYYKWDSGLFGSRKYYRNRLYRLLTDMIGNDIVTGCDYNVLIPDIFEKKHYSSDLYNKNWLHIHGPADSTSIKELSEKGNDYIKEVERNKYLFFLSGKIENFRIEETGYGRNIHLYLETVKISQPGR